MYLSRTAEEFGRLEEKIKLFLRNFNVKSQAQVFTKFGVPEEQRVDIYPDKNGRIEEVCPIIAQPNCILIRSTPKFVVLNLEGTKYQVQYDPD